ncbi:hypothetical protein [Skermania piniformis]|uniref:Uncharacterized protein n=1 Tax=Skermania pinensis TaxID=39122 RepID=A0ABX8SC28_9ACTN|nr:hypothetical protein [Skermania piniformis]QXQ14871.1 hypothetical protein KV203_05670 [Skermania piniformis]
MAVAAAAGLLLLPGCGRQVHDRCLVDGKDRTTTVRDGKQASDMRVYTTCGTFTVTDNWVSGNRSADLYGSLREGRTYRFETTGYRSGLLSQFPTIVAAQEVGP